MRTRTDLPPVERPGLVGIAPSAGRRLLDLGVASLALVLLAPVFAAIWIAIRATSRGPAIFRQERVGQGGVLFTLYKFRTMRVGGTGPAVTVRGDPRVTRIGAFLRKTSLDELPQFVNVLRGDMTLVGPRPETPDLASRYPAPSKAVFRYRPGMTGPAQLELRDDRVIPPDIGDLDGFYLTFVAPQRTAVDLQYLEHPTIRATVRVLMATFAEVVRPLRGSGPRRSE
ncbi:MAG: sugar transferase [Actinomycetota bacterium]